MTSLSDIIQSFLTRENFFVIGNLFSIASFILSIVVLWNIRKLRNAYKLRVRGPSLIRELQKSKSSLTTYLNEFSDAIPQIAAELGRVSVKLKSLERKLRRDPKRAVRRVRLLIDQCEVKAQNEERVRSTHIEIIKIIEELKEHQKDLDWEL